MKPSKVLNQTIMEVVQNQLRDGDPPETKQTYDRLLASGLPEAEVRRLLACVVTKEIFLIGQEKRPFDRKRFVANLHRLPEMPEGWDDE